MASWNRQVCQRTFESNPLAVWVLPAIISVIMSCDQFQSGRVFISLGSIRTPRALLQASSLFLYHSRKAWRFYINASVKADGKIVDIMHSNHLRMARLSLSFSLSAMRIIHQSIWRNLLRTGTRRSRSHLLVALNMAKPSCHTSIWYGHFERRADIQTDW